MSKTDLKVGDLIPLSKDTYDQTLECIEKLTNLSIEYSNMTDFYDPFQLEEIKRKWNGYMTQFAVCFSKIKKFKGSQHVYCDEVRKEIKSQALQLLLDEGVKVTSAESLVYGTEYYKERVLLIQDVKEFFIKTDLLYERFEYTFQAIIQSLSTARKEYDASKHT